MGARSKFTNAELPGGGVLVVVDGTERDVGWKMGREVDWNALLASRFWSMVLAALYQFLGEVSRGHPYGIVAIMFWTWGSNPFRNLTTMVLGSVYPDSDTSSKNSSK